MTPSQLITLLAGSAYSVFKNGGDTYAYKAGDAAFRVPGEFTSNTTVPTGFQFAWFNPIYYVLGDPVEWPSPLNASVPFQCYVWGWFIWYRQNSWPPVKFRELDINPDLYYCGTDPANQPLLSFDPSLGANGPAMVLFPMPDPS